MSVGLSTPCRFGGRSPTISWLSPTCTTSRPSFHLGSNPEPVRNIACNARFRCSPAKLQRDVDRSSRSGIQGREIRPHSCHSIRHSGQISRHATSGARMDYVAIDRMRPIVLAGLAIGSGRLGQPRDCATLNRPQHGSSQCAQQGSAGLAGIQSIALLADCEQSMRKRTYRDEAVRADAARPNVRPGICTVSATMGRPSIDVSARHLERQLAPRVALSSSGPSLSFGPGIAGHIPRPGAGRHEETLSRGSSHTVEAAPGAPETPHPGFRIFRLSPSPNTGDHTGDLPS